MQLDVRVPKLIVANGLYWKITEIIHADIGYLYLAQISVYNYERIYTSKFYLKEISIYNYTVLDGINE